MDDSDAVFTSSTRRNFLTATASLAATSATGVAATAQSSADKAEYEIGLPLEQQWSTSFGISNDIGAAKVGPGSQIDDTYYLKLDETDLDPAKIIAYDVENNSERWELTAGDYVSPPVVIDDTLVVSVLSDVKAYSATDPSDDTLWEYTAEMDIASQPSWAGDGFLVPEYDADSRFSGPNDYTYDTGRLSLFDLDGNKEWSVNGEFIGAPYREGDSVIHYEASQYREDDDYYINSGRVVSRSLETGTIEWKSPDFNVWSIRSTPLDLVLAYTRDDAVRALNTNTGEVEWTVDVGTGIEDIDAGPIHLYVGKENSLKAIDYASGKVAWTTNNIQPYDVSHTGGLVLIGAYGGNFSAFDPETGEAVWEYSHPRGNGFVRYDDGSLYLFSANRLTMFNGQRGEAVAALENARDAEGLTTTVANFVGRSAELSRAETAINDQRYQEALAAIDSADTRKSAVDFAATLITGGAVYGGARTTGKQIQAYRIEAALDQLEADYPIESGALEGLTPTPYLEQAQVAKDSLQQSRFGPALRVLATQRDDYSPLIRTLEHLHDASDDLRDISDDLDAVTGEFDIEPWRQRFEEQLTADGEIQEKTLGKCRRAISVTKQFAEVTDAVRDDTVELSQLKSELATVQSTTETPAAIDAYVQAALEALTTYANSYQKLKSYDLSPVQNQLNQALQTDPMKTDSGVPLFESTDILLGAATEAEQARTDINYSHTGFTAGEVTTSISEALSTFNVSKIQATAETLQNLKRGVWKPEHLQAYTPYEFEHLIADLYSDLGYSTEVTQEGSDGGIDVVATGDGEKLIIQVKQYSRGNKIGRPTIQQTAGVRDQFGADKAVVVTSSSFTGTARDASRDYGERMELIDGQRLRKMLSQSRLAPPVQSQANSRSNKRNNRSRQHQASSNQTQNSSSAYNRQSGSYCMVCEQHFQFELETIEIHTGETVRCCPRCKQLIEEATDVNEHDREDALAVLDLSPGATDAEIKDAYRSRVTEVHPDQGGEREEFQEVQQAYETLF